jgi:hypothetical protein
MQHCVGTNLYSLLVKQQHKFHNKLFIKQEFLVTLARRNLWKSTGAFYWYYSIEHL